LVFIIPEILLATILMMVYESVG